MPRFHACIYRVLHQGILYIWGVYVQRHWEREPTISLSEAAIVYNIGRGPFLSLFRQELSETVRWFKGSKGYRLLLTDVMRAAYPEADNMAIHMMSLDFVCRLRVSRRLKYGGGKPIL